MAEYDLILSIYNTIWPEKSVLISNCLSHAFWKSVVFNANCQNHHLIVQHLLHVEIFNFLHAHLFPHVGGYPLKYDVAVVLAEPASDFLVRNLRQWTETLLLLSLPAQVLLFAGFLKVLNNNWHLLLFFVRLNGCYCVFIF